MNNTLFSVVIPAHNESENVPILIPRLFAELERLPGPYEVFFVDNASTDRTLAIIESFEHTYPKMSLLSEPQLGYGRAVLRGLAATRGEYIGIIRSDNQEKPEDLVQMFERIQREGVDLYKGVRITRKNDGRKRLVVSLVYNFLFKAFFHLKSRDLNAVPKVFTRRFYEAARLSSSDWFIDPEIVIKAETLGYRVREMNIEYMPRLRGASSIRLRHIFEFLQNMLVWHARFRHGRLLEK